jgi:RHS repeat-associated protein
MLGTRNKRLLWRSLALLLALSFGFMITACPSGLSSFLGTFIPTASASDSGSVSWDGTRPSASLLRPSSSGDPSTLTSGVKPLDASNGAGEHRLGDIKHRYYDPSLGRFISRDPLGVWGDAGNIGNAQSAFGGNPVNRRDPWGLDDNDDDSDKLDPDDQQALEAQASKAYNDISGSELWKSITKGAHVDYSPQWKHSGASGVTDPDYDDSGAMTGGSDVHLVLAPWPPALRA